MTTGKGDLNPNRIPKYVLGDGPVPRTPEPVDEPKPWKETKIVGQRMARVDAYERVSGSATYTYDVMLPGMLYAAVLRCPHAHAIVKSVDTSAAEKMPGVHAIMTKDSAGADIPWYGSGSNPQSRLFDPHCRYAGDEVAAVAADNPWQAWDAVRAIKVEYEVLPFVLDEAKALEPTAPKLYENGNAAGNPSVYNRGDVDKGFAEADAIVEGTYNVAPNVHVPLETHGDVAKWDGNKLILWDSTQGVYRVMMDVARTLGLPFNNVQVICKYMGGAFGSKLEVWKQAIIAALLAKRTARPVKLMLTREESLHCVGYRPGSNMWIRIGVKKDGTITAIDYKNVASPGGYAGGAGTAFQTADLYSCDNVRYEEKFSYTNMSKSAAMRAPGFPQGSWSLEQAMDDAARAIGMDPVEFRLKNAPAISQLDQQRRPYTYAGLAESLRAGAKAFGWDEAKKKKKGDGHIKRGVGMAASVWAVGGGGPPSTVIARMFVDGGVTVRTGAMDIGTGTKTILAMVVAEELGIPVDRVRIENADTANTPYASPSGGSKTLPTEGPAARMAAVELKRSLFAFAAEQLGVPADEIDFIDNELVHRADPAKKMALGQVMQRSGILDVVGVGYRGQNPSDKIIRTWSAQFAEVEVNTLTGKVNVTRLLGAHESGRVINRLTYDNQSFGGMTQGLAFGMTEGRIMDAGQTGTMVNKNWLDYKIPTSKEIPLEFVTVPVEGDVELCNNLGSKGLGEPPVIPTAAAIANAIYDATGVRPTKTPVTPVEMIRLLSQKGRA